MKPSRIEEGRFNTDDNNNMLEGEAAADEGSNTASFLIIILSLFFVAIFGYALVGGVISGDPTNGFFVTLIVASVLAIIVAIGVLVRYIYMKRTRTNNNNDDQYLSKDNKGTFSASDEENQYDEEYVPRPRANEYQFPNRNHVDPAIREIQAKSVIGEMSALSPASFGGDSLSTFRHHIIRDHHINGRQGFDFSRINPAEEGENVVRRRQMDPPEVGAATIEAAWNLRGSSQEPSAPKFSTEGDIIEDQPYSKGDNVESRNDIEDHDDEEKSVKATSSLRPKSPANSIAKSLPPSILKKKGKHAPKRPSSTRSVPVKMLAPSTPAASEAGSLASSFFGMFGKGKKAASEAGASNTIETNVKKAKSALKKSSNEGKPPMVKPPMLPPSNKKGLEEKMKTMERRIGSTPSTPGNKSTFTIPPPRPIPRTPMGSEVFSEFQSGVGSPTASSTFDPVAHQRALEKLREVAAPIGASPAMPIYYNDDNEDDDDNDSSVALNAVDDSTSLAYDVFAPPGALGIVVDTTEKGCIVYSLKKTSPMQGLMNKGDLIIGLDNFDVRNMDAASLTKLMAKKAQQTERKFTLMPNNSE